MVGALVLFWAVLSAAGPGADPPAATEPAPSPRSEDGGQPAGKTAAGAAGIRVHLDPETGRVIERASDPRAELPPRGLGDRLNTYGGDLLQEALPDGGFKVDLRGRFRSAVVATIDPVTDEVEIDCVPVPVSDEASDGR
jgi:hypothetical protein